MGGAVGIYVLCNVFDHSVMKSETLYLNLYEYDLIILAVKGEDEEVQRVGPGKSGEILLLVKLNSQLANIL